MGVPAFEMKRTKNPIALVLTPGNKLEFRKIKLISSKFMLMKPWGIFELAPGKHSGYERNTVYFYDTRSAKPFPLSHMKELQDFAKDNALHKITRKDVRQASMLRRLMTKGKTKDEALTEIKDQEEQSKKQIMSVIEEIDGKINESLSQEGEKPQIDPNEYSSVIIDELVSRKLIERDEAFSLKLKMIKGEIDIDDFVRRIADLKMVEIGSPISLDLEKVLDDYRAYDPAMVDAFIDRAEKIGEKIKKMGTPVIKSFGHIWVIFIVMIVAIVLGATFSSMDFSNIKMPSLIPKMIFGLAHGSRL